jgi:hypothetical protein
MRKRREKRRGIKVGLALREIQSERLEVIQIDDKRFQNGPGRTLDIMSIHR